MVELVVVITLLGILAAGTTVFLRHTVGGYLDTARRDQLASTARIAVERIARELRNAVPNSVRASGDGRCIEFMPLAGAGIYQDRDVIYTAGGISSAPLPVTGHTAAAASSFDALDLEFTPASGTAYRVLVYPLNADEAYTDTAPGGSGASLPYQDAVTAANVSRIRFGDTYSMPRHSPQRRFHITAGPVSFCVTAGQLLRYGEYALSAAQPAPGGFGVSGRLMAENIRLSDAGSPVRVFSVTPQSLTRNAIVKIDMRVSDANEWVRLDHEVQLRNAP